MFEQSFKNIDDILMTAGCSSELEYIEQTSWILFLRYLDDLEESKKREAALAGSKYEYILAPNYRWKNWAAPDKKALTGKDLMDFVNNDLFEYLKKLRAEEATTIQYKIGEIFHELKNRISSGYRLRDI